jgi:hypothetical protein
MIGVVEVWKEVEVVGKTGGFLLRSRIVAPTMTIMTAIPTMA